MTSWAIIPSDTRRDLLLQLKRQGTLSLDEAEDATGLTRTTLRQHMARLERDGLVERSTIRQGRGRPSLRYRLTADAERLFPNRDGVLLGGLLEFLQKESREDLIAAFFEQFWAERLREARHRMDNVSPDDWPARINVLAEFLREQGFMPEISVGEEGLVIRECNCPFQEAVRQTRLPCRLEAEFFEHLFDERIGRAAYIPDGSPACTYEFPHPEAAR